ncbi:GIY-YIG nuclease family protein [Vibrio fluvialis]|uniref:GIY-YIG nuclease family protein n=1 Tax=Vibrio fluvialis TaxID=676 RepID=UPI00096B7ADA|nr:GIY-YIG nuclease family protein [Vibrio fluvialis]
MLIKAYGTYWNPEMVEWGSRGAGQGGKLVGTVKFDSKTKKEIDFWDAKGIYVLHSEYKTIYVGKAFGTSIGKRLRDHLTDRLAGRWDMFSWYSVSAPKKVEGGVTKPGKRQIGPETYIDTFEALAILISDPPLNRKRESLKSAYEVSQKEQPNPRTLRSYLEEILTEVKKS